MKPQSRLEYKSTVSPDGLSEVASDGRTVWINRGECLARFCPISREYSAVDAKDSTTGVAYGVETHRHPESGPTEADWAIFVSTVKRRWGIEVSEEHTPLYILKI